MKCGFLIYTRIFITKCSHIDKYLSVNMVNIILNKRILGVILLFLFFCCSNSKHPLIVQSSPSKALIILMCNVEGNSGGIIQDLFTLKGDSALEIIGQILKVEPNKLKGLSIDQIVNFYGEPFVLSNINITASNHYDTILFLIDSNATFNNFVQGIRNLNPKFILDVIVDLHGDSTGWLFADGFYWKDELFDSLCQLQKIRALYQTCCFGSLIIDTLSKTGICAINGAYGYNNLILYSPINFIKNWVNGQSFETAVQNAYMAELDSLRILVQRANLPIGKQVVKI
jgi:hypothetical protein